MPIYKKKGNERSIDQYRPISLLCNLSKVFEKINYKRVMSYLGKNDFFSKRQFGFRKGLSTSQAIALLVNSITN